MSFDLRTSRLAMAGGLLLMVGAALGAGCSSGPDETYPFPDEASFCEALATVQCNANVVGECYGSTGADLGADTETCVKVRSSRASCNPLGLAYHPEPAQACLDQQQSAWAQAAPTADDLKAVNDACIGVFTRGKGEGATCSADTDCDAANGLRCILHDAASGQCHTPVLVSAGNKCTGVADQCEAGYHCDDGGHCVSNPEIGDACGVGLPCNDNAFCSNEVCVGRKNNGASCLSADECSGGFCLEANDGGICSATYKLDFGTTCEEFR